MPTNTASAFVRAAIDLENSSSALRITYPPGFSASASIPFSCAIASRVPMNSMCAMPMLVMIATSGAAISASGAISPGWFMPISNTPDLVAAARAQHGERQTDVVVQIPFRFRDLEFLARARTR